ncbi:MAG TPA: helix-turn-helix transcriptional regulator [Polyangiaceae bacterium]|nr:helix-turn-helix transcriptional regulator [Polyangiaceae bacterium]
MQVARFVEEVRVYESTPGQRHRIDRLPDGRTLFVFRKLAENHGDLSVAGPRTQAYTKEAGGIQRAVVIQIKPGWAPAMLGVGARRLTDHVVSLEEIWGSSARSLLADLLSTGSADAAIERITHAFATRLPLISESASARLARRAVLLLEEQETSIESLAARLGVTARHLRRAFTDTVGIGPKEFARSARLRRAVRHTSTSHTLGRIAADAGYYDQAHLARDFRELLGVTPSSYVKHGLAR